MTGTVGVATAAGTMGVETGLGISVEGLHDTARAAAPQTANASLLSVPTRTCPIARRVAAEVFLSGDELTPWPNMTSPEGIRKKAFRRL